MHSVELDTSSYQNIRILESKNSARTTPKSGGGLSFCQHVAIYSNRLSYEKKGRRWMAGDACNDAAHEVIGKPKPGNPATEPKHTIPHQAMPGQAKKVAN